MMMDDDSMTHSFRFSQNLILGLQQHAAALSNKNGTRIYICDNRPHCQFARRAILEGMMYMWYRVVISSSISLAPKLQLLHSFVG